ncbi:uncharacterized protein LTR77_010050 [Saxophila tyrrhenica]|uniref:Zn(2)-C6 fungal-type domain-containing protein n=1 Tax=Saxophila tyrrhenica TaxID=1690608 RepID=A0AAV9NWQ1_9PEZI|nr:hypothetical protein LTR77_010050 [Saxophila tyrrhenica]
METPQIASMHSFQVPAQPVPKTQSYPQTPPQQSDSTDRARAYKSRNKRPCDFCRYKKAACHLESQPPCELCIRYHKDCTFVESPAKRRRPNENSNENGQNALRGMRDFKQDRNGSLDSSASYMSGIAGNGAFEMQQELFDWENGIPPFQMPVGDIGSAGLVFALDPAFYDDPSMAGLNMFDPMSAQTAMAFPQMKPDSSLEAEPSPSSAASSRTPQNLALPFDLTSGEPSLDQQKSSNSTVLGLSGETDPYLLSRYRFDEHNEASFQSIRIRKMDDGAENSIPTFFSIQHNALASKAQPQEGPDILTRYRRELDSMVSDAVGRRLIRLFYRYVQPYFPVLSENDIREPSNVPTALLAAIYGHALPFCAWDEKLCVDVFAPPSADALFRIAWTACVPTFHTPSLATLQTLLLLVQRRPTNKNVSDTPFKGVMISAAVSVAQSLGLNRDPSDWPLPAWELRLRRRLSWAMFIQDKWLALNSGRMGYIQTDDWDIAMLTEADLAEQNKQPRDAQPASPVPPQDIVKLCELTTIISDILHDLYSVKATKALQNSLEATLEVAKPLRIRLTEWHHSLPPGLLTSPLTHSSPDSAARRKSSVSHELDGSGSLHLAYITAKISLFRAMLRPQSSSSNSNAISALRTGALAVAREIHDFLEHLNARELEAFWASYSRTNFTIASSFMLLLFVTSPDSEDAKECLELLCAWRALLRVKSRSCDLLNLALLKVDGVFVGGMENVVELSPAALEVWEESGKASG